MAEAKKPWWHGGIAIWKVFARPESFCTGKFPDHQDSLDILWMVPKVSGLPGKYPDRLDIFWMNRQVSG